VNRVSYFFAGGGTGGHIYPGLAIAEQVAAFQTDAKIHFFCSERVIDSYILAQAGFKYSPLAARAFSISPAKLAAFFKSSLSSYAIAKKILAANQPAVLVGIGGFASVGPVLAARRLGIPIYLLSVDIVPGRANRFLARFAKEIFVQFEESSRYFRASSANVTVTGCPLRARFGDADANAARKALDLDADKKVLVVTGASSGAKNVNDAVCAILNNLSEFADGWQIVHLTGRAHFEQVRKRYERAVIKHKVLAYYDQMADLLAGADLVIGRSGAVSVAEYAAAAVPSICMPYPHHKDMHQYLNAGKLVEAGAAVIVDDLPDLTDRAEWLWEELEQLMNSEEKRQEMRHRCRQIVNSEAASKIAKVLTKD